MDKKNRTLIIIVGVLLVIVVGVTFAYFAAGLTITGEGSGVEGNTAKLINVKYDAGTSKLETSNLTPGHSTSKGFKVIVTPGSDANTATYRIILNITENTFVKCDDVTYDAATNPCIKEAEEITYTLKDGSGAVIKTGDLTGSVTGEIELIRETKTVSTATDYNYTIEIEFKDTNNYQNHNQNKVITGEVKVEFAEPVITKDDILAGLTIGNRGSITEPLTTNTTGTVYSAADDDGTSYYYAGAVDNNWVKFAGKYWRIIRFNGDGTIRLIYSGTSATATGTGTQTTTSTYNANYNDNAYVGFMYGQTGQGTYAATHANTNNSTIKGVLDSWYTSNLASYADKIDKNAGFCNDRKVATGHSSYTGGGYGTGSTVYAPADRILTANLSSWKTNHTPSLACSQTNDLFTATSSAKGNKKLTNPIGLITSDEVVFGGGFANQNNTSYYLYTNQDYWTMSPWHFSGSTAVVFSVNSIGVLSGYYNAANTFGVRPVINLKADTLFNTGGTGTSSNPYVVQ